MNSLSALKTEQIPNLFNPGKKIGSLGHKMENDKFTILTLLIS